MLGPSLESLRPSMTCAICCELMTDPVIVCENGHCYDRPCISSWNRPCPECRQPLLSSWIPNRIIKENAARLQQPPAESLAPRVQLSPDDLLINAFKTNDLEAARQATDQDASFWSADAINHVSTQEMFSLLVNTFSKARMNLLREAVKQNKLDSLVMLWSLKPFVYPPNTPTVLHVACQQKNSVALHFLLSY